MMDLEIFPVQLVVVMVMMFESKARAQQIRQLPLLRKCQNCILYLRQEYKWNRAR